MPDSSAPNIIFILIDDLGWRDLGCYGSTFYETPNLDRLARQGMLFTDAYASCPVCSPTRASVQTGRYPARVGVTNFLAGHARGRVVEPEYVEHMPLEEHTIAQALGDAGYQTWHVGKWHLGSGEQYWPHNRGYDENIAGCGWGMPANGYFSPWGIATLEDGPEGEYLTDRLTDEAINLIETADESRPFFLNMCYYTVHVPIQGRQDHVDRFREKAMSLKLDQIDPFVEGEQFPCEHKRDQRVTRRQLQSDPEYAAMVWSMDENIGRLLQAVEDAGQADNTTVFFTSDNGGLSTAEGAPTCNYPLHEGKGWMYEGGTREPLLVSWPGVTEPGSVCDEPVTTPDFYPTMLEMAGADLIPEQHVDGVSLAPLLDGGSIDREAIYWHYPHYGNQGGTPGSSVRSGDWKLIEFFEDGHLELYNLREDLSETVNLAEELPNVADGMHRMLQAWRAEIGADLPTPNPEWGG